MLRCFYTNADSLSNKKNELAVVISTSKPDIIVVTEVLPKNCDVRPTEDEFQVKNYNIFSNFKDSNCSRGVIILVNDTLKSIKKLDGLPEIDCGESVWCEIKLKNKDTLLLGGVYRSPNSSTVADTNINSFLTQLKMPTHALICGDFNTQKSTGHLCAQISLMNTSLQSFSMQFKTASFFKM